MYSPSSSSLVISALPANVSLKHLFSNLQHLPYAMLLETAGGVPALGRYNIMVWDPAIVIESRRGETSIEHTGSGTKTVSSDTPFETVKVLVAQYYRHITITSDLPEDEYLTLPFHVGSAGLASYDVGRYYETLPAHSADDYACPDFAVGLFEQSIIEDTHTGKLYSCRLAHKPEYQTQHQQSSTHSTSFALTGDWCSNLTKPDYLTALERIHQYLYAGDCYQVNMAQRFSAPYTGSEWQAYNTLSEANKAPFSAFMRLPDACILSITPERFLSVLDGKVETKPIKGTRPRFEDPVADQASADNLLSAEKDRAENLMIVDLLRNDLSKHCSAGTVKVPSLFALESYAAVHHMVSTVTGELNPQDSPLDLLAGAFPGGSITGAPKIRAMEIIDELEPHRRSVYCGSIFYMGHRQDMDSSILIRTILAERGQLYCWAGGGIVIDSVAADEYQETLDKVSRILPILEVQRE